MKLVRQTDVKMRQNNSVLGLYSVISTTFSKTWLV